MVAGLMGKKLEAQNSLLSGVAQIESGGGGHWVQIQKSDKSKLMTNILCG